MSPSRYQSLDCFDEIDPTSSPIVQHTLNMDTSCKTQDACRPTAMIRTDSGFGENGNTPDSTLSRASSGKVIEECKVRPIRSHQHHASIHSANPPSPSSSHPTGYDAAHLARRRSPERTSSRKQSATTDSYRSSRSSSRRSSFVAQTTGSHNRRPARPNRSLSTYSRPVGDPILLYQRSKSLFESPENALNYYNPPPALSLGDLTSPSSPSLPPLSTISAEDLAHGLLTKEEENASTELQYTNHVPATIIDWTLPSTRRREYRKIESCCRGIPGLWRRFAPGFLQKNRRLTFYDDEKDDDDAGSVRRYRLELPEDRDEKTNSIVKANTSKFPPEKVKRRWSCIGSSQKSFQG